MIILFTTKKKTYPNNSEYSQPLALIDTPSKTKTSVNLSDGEQRNFVSIKSSSTITYIIYYIYYILIKQPPSHFPLGGVNMDQLVP